MEDRHARKDERAAAKKHWQPTGTGSAGCQICVHTASGRRIMSGRWDIIGVLSDVGHTDGQKLF